MASPLEYVPALTRLGLTEYEAKVYATLVKTGSRTAGELSFLSGVPRTKLYGSVRGLERKGLVRILRHKPETITAASPNEVLFPLAEKLIKEAEESLEQIQNLALAYESMKLISSRRMFSKTELSTLEGRQTISENVRRLLSGTSESVEMLATANGMVRLYKSHSKIVERISSRGVKVRLIAPVTMQNASVAKEMVAILKFRSLPRVDFEAIVGDSNTIIFFEAMPDDLEEETGNDVGVLSENPQTIKVFKRLYDLVWATLPTATETLRAAARA